MSKSSLRSSIRGMFPYGHGSRLIASRNNDDLHLSNWLKTLVICKFPGYTIYTGDTTLVSNSATKWSDPPSKILVDYHIALDYFVDVKG